MKIYSNVLLMYIKTHGQTDSERGGEIQEDRGEDRETEANRDSRGD